MFPCAIIYTILSNALAICNAHETDKTYLQRFWCCNIAFDSLQCFYNGPMHTASVFHIEFAYVVIVSLYYPFNSTIFVFQLVETIVCFTLSIIEHSFSIFITSLNHILVLLSLLLSLLSWIGDKLQLHFFFKEGKTKDRCIGFILSIVKMKSLESLILCIRICGIILIFNTYYCMSPHQFDYILQFITPLIYKLNTNFWCSISVKEKLPICIR